MEAVIKSSLKLLTVSLLLLLLQSNTNETVKVYPFCGFNAKNGYYTNNRGETVYEAVLARKGDASGVPDVVATIMKKLQVDVPITVYIVKKTGNCSATIVDGGRRVLIVDNKFLNKVNEKSGTEWAAISVIAHEVGHHISGFGRYDNSLQAELDADYWSGFILQKLGA